MSSLLAGAGRGGVKDTDERKIVRVSLETDRKSRRDGGPIPEAWKGVFEGVRWRGVPGSRGTLLKI